MFATLAGAYPRTPLAGHPFPLRVAYGQLERGEIEESDFRAVQDELVEEVIAEQEEAGLELLTDGHVRWDDPITGISDGLDGFERGGLIRYFDTNTYYRRPRAVREPRWVAPITVADWQFAAACTDLPVKQTLVGPYTLARLSDRGGISRERLTMALADALAQEIQALAEAGCPMIQIDEDAATLINDGAERKLYKAAHRRLTYRASGVHLSLAITMGSAHRAGPEALFDAPYRSYFFDLIKGPNNWQLVTEIPTDRGVIAGVSDARSAAPDSLELLRWAGQYAAAMHLRGADRVGLAPSTSLEHLPRERARAKIDLLGRTAIELSAAAAEGALVVDTEYLANIGLARGFFGTIPAEAMEEARRILATSANEVRR